MATPPTPLAILQRLIRFDTTNPPGSERACIGYIEELIRAAGGETTLLGRDPERPNLIARAPGRGDAPPLLLYGHVDVVTTAGQQWTHPPFEAAIEDGFVWGRGALDMKGGVAMMLAAFLHTLGQEQAPPGDLVFCALADEEAGGDWGARFLVSEHAEQFAGIRHALGEFGGFSQEIGGRRFYPIMVGEKQICWLRLTIPGPGGHGSLPMRGGAMARLGQLLTRLDGLRLPHHATDIPRRMIGAIADRLGGAKGFLMRRLLDARWAPSVLAIMGERGRPFEPLLANTINATRVHGGDKINVIPAAIELELDGRLLPGFGPDDLIGELRPHLPDEVRIEVLRHDPGPGAADYALLDLLSDVLRAADPAAIPIPFLLPGVTDARFFSRLGIQTYGFLPMILPESMSFTRLIHAADERLPVEAVDFGTAAIIEAIRRRTG